SRSRSSGRRGARPGTSGSRGYRCRGASCRSSATSTAESSVVTATRIRSAGSTTRSPASAARTPASRTRSPRSWRATRPCRTRTPCCSRCRTSSASSTTRACSRRSRVTWRRRSAGRRRVPVREWEEVMPLRRPVNVVGAKEPAELARYVEEHPQLPSASCERVSGYGVMGLPFESGHILGLRRWTASSVGDAFTSIWYRDPAGRWMFYESVRSEIACTRYFGASVDEVRRGPIELEWPSERRLRVRTADGAVDWTLELGATAL